MVMDDRQEEMWDALCELSGEQVLRLMTDWHGLQLLDDEFRGFLIDEGVMPEDEPDDELEDDFDSFCCKHTACNGCQLRSIKGDCEENWEKLKEEEE